MFELASRLVGVYKVNHMTKSVTVENKDYIVRQQPSQASQRPQQVKAESSQQQQQQQRAVKA